MDTKTKKEYSKIIQHFGVDAQIQKCEEELHELTIELYNYQRERASENLEKIRENIKQEIADVFNMLYQMLLIFDFSIHEIADIRQQKNKRTLKRIKEGYYE